MGWWRAAIVACAAVAALAGAVSLVAEAVVANQDPPRLISFDKLTGSCPLLPDAAPPGPSPTSCGGQVWLPVGASEQEVIGALGEPQNRRTLGVGDEAWNYMRSIGGNWRSESEAAGATLWFHGHRLVGAEENIYIFK